MPVNELAAYVLEVALTHSKDAFPAGDHSVRMPWHASASKICISVDLISSLEYQFADHNERKDMRDFIKAKIDAFMGELNEGSQTFKLDLEFPCEVPAPPKSRRPSHE